MTNPLGFHVIQGFPDNTIYLLNTDGLADLLREMHVSLEDIVSKSPNVDQAKLEREIVKRRLAVILKNVTF